MYGGESIIDYGKGIDTTKIKKVFDDGYTLGKDNGKGIGLTYSKKTLTRYNGLINISSIKEKNTTVCISLPITTPPEWLVTRLDINAVNDICILDDEEIIHKTMSQRLKSNNKSQKIHSFKLYNDFNKFLLNNSSSNIKFIIDYDLKNKEYTGIDIIIKHNLIDKAILVTGHYDDPSLIKKCKKYNISLLPKSWAAKIPINLIS